MIIDNFRHFKGQHCETTATGSLLQQIGIELSEPMLFGLGEGLEFIFWKMKTMDFPFIGGRVKPDVLTENICRNLNLTLEVTETSSTKKAWQNLTKHIENGTAVGVKLDCYHLEYFTNKIHFAGHYAALYGYDDEYAYLIDTAQQGGKVKTTLKNLERARSEKGPMSSRNLSYTISKKGGDVELPIVIKQAIHNNAVAYLNPPIKNISYKGILKASSEIQTWFKNSNDVKGDFQATAMLMERAGTGGSLFRKFYRDFLLESAEIMDSPKIFDCYKEFSEIADQWKQVSELFDSAGETGNIEFIDKASEILVSLSERERITMERLLRACCVMGSEGVIYKGRPVLASHVAMIGSNR